MVRAKEVEGRHRPPRATNRVAASRTVSSSFVSTSAGSTANSARAHCWGPGSNGTKNRRKAIFGGSEKRPFCRTIRIPIRPPQGHAISAQKTGSENQSLGYLDHSEFPQLQGVLCWNVPKVSNFKLFELKSVFCSIAPQTPC